MMAGLFVRRIEPASKSKMFVAIVGTPCSGKASVLQYFLDKAFLSVALEGGANDSATNEVTEPPNQPWDASHLILHPQHAAIDTAPRQAFRSSAEMLDFATRNWRSNFVTTSLCTRQDLEAFTKRPFFLLLGADAPIVMRWNRYTSKFVIALLITPGFLTLNRVSQVPKPNQCGSKPPGFCGA